MKNWKFIKVGNSDKEFKSEQELRRWAIDHQYTYKPTHGGYYMLEDDSGKGREPIEAHVSQPVVNKTGNKKTGNKRYFSVEEEGGDSRSFQSLSEAKSFADKWRSEGKQTVHIFEIEENDKDPDDFRVVRTINSSIEKQTWSMFKGLSKDAEKEVGNTRLGKFLMEGGHTAELVEEGGKFIIKFDDGSTETFMTRKAADSYLKAHSELYIGNKKIGNQSAQERFLDDINGIKEKYKQEGKEINLSRLMYELKRIGWAESDFTKLKWPTNIGNTAHSDKVEVIKRLLAGGWSVEDIYSQLKTEGYEVEKSFIEKLKTGNAAVGAEVVAREVVEGKEYIVEKTSLRNGQDVQFNLYYSMDGSGKRHAGVFKDKDAAVSAGKKIVGNETAEEKKFGHVMREFDRGELKSSSGETVTNPEQAKAIAYSEADKVNNLKRARNAMTKNAMGVSDLEAQIKKNKEFIRQQNMRMNGKSKPEQDDIAEGIREAQDEIDRMEMRIAELKGMGNKKTGNRKAIGSHFDMNDYGIEVGQWSWDWRGSPPDRKTMQDIARKIKDYARQIDRDVPEGDSDERDEVFAKLDRFMQTQGLK